MEFCNFHKGYCKKIVNIIEFKKGKIKELNLCMDCLCNYLNIDEPSLINEKDISEIKNLVDECYKCGLNKKDLYSNKLLCPYCYNHFSINKKEDKISLIKSKIKYAVEIEDYENALILKKELENILKD